MLWFHHQKRQKWCRQSVTFGIKSVVNDILGAIYFLQPKRKYSLDNRAVFEIKEKKYQAEKYNASGINCK